MQFDRGGDTADSAGYDVFLVEDDKELAHLITLCLEDLGLRARTLRRGADALAAIQESSAASDSVAMPRALLTDYHLPDFSGLSLVKKLHEEGIRLPSLLITGVFDADLPAETLDVVDGVLRKPFLMEELSLAVRRVLGDPPPEPHRQAALR